MVSRGFTLLESMLVLFLISLVFSAVIPILATPSSPKTQKEAERFISLLTQYREKADASNMVFGIYPQPESYTFVQRYQEGWKPVSPSRLATTVVVEKPVRMSLEPSNITTEQMRTFFQHRLQLSDMPSGLASPSGNSTLYPPRIWFIPAEPSLPFIAQFTVPDTQECWQVVMDNDELRSGLCEKISW